jgi:hypothetical protein
MVVLVIFITYTWEQNDTKRIKFKKRVMKILMLGWELPPHNSGGLGMVCLQLCKSLAKRDIDIEFVLPYEADHGIDFMTITAATPQGSGHRYSFWHCLRQLQIH